MSRKRSVAWRYFNEVNESIACCKICKKEISYKGGGTSNLKKHMNCKHPTVDYNKKIDESCSDDEQSTSAKVQKTLEDCYVNLKLSNERVQLLNKSLVKLVTKDLQPLSIVENKGFQSFVKALNPAYKLPSRYILTNTFLTNSYKERYKKVEEMLKDAESICITTDAWTSAANESYISLTSHFISKDWELNSLYLNCFKTIENHTAENLKDKLKEACHEWKIQNKISCVVSDNGPNILAAVRIAGWNSLPCFAHTLHLIVTNALKEYKIETILNKCKSIVEYFHRSTKATNKLKEIQKQMDKKQLKLKNSTPTRWNSTLHMIKRFIINQESVEATLAILRKPMELLTSEEFNILKEICKILNPFDEITVEISAEKYPTVSKIIPLVRSLQSFLVKHKAENISEETAAFLERIVYNINRRFNQLEFNEVLAISTYLDPRFKSKAFADANAAKLAKEKILSLYNIPPEEIPSPPKSTKKSSIWDEFDIKTKSHTVTNTMTSKGIIEINNYGHEETLDRNSDPLLWWKSRENVYPGLSAIAKKYISIVATSVPSERMFSTAGEVVSDRRTLLKSENVEKILFLHHNED